jgi:hypothetical protein
MRLRSLLLCLGLTIGLMPPAFAIRGVIDDPDGFTYVRAGESQDSAIVAKVKAGEVFDFEEDDLTHLSEWSKVTLASGKKGYMHGDRIRIHATMADLADRKPDDEANVCARAKGLNYYSLARDAARGKKAAMQTYFALSCVGEGEGEDRAENIHDEICRSVIHLLGDEKLSKFLRGQSKDYLTGVREMLESTTPHPGDPHAYLKRVFPKSERILDTAPP